MFLYHGTWDDNKDDILKLGYIDNMCAGRSYDDTAFLDTVFEKHLGYNPRGLCIYLSNDNETADAYDFAFRVDANSLNTNLLYVGSNEIAQNIYLETTRVDIDDEKIKVLAKSYEKSFMPFDKYLETNGKVDFHLEFLYFGEIIVSEEHLF